MSSIIRVDLLETMLSQHVIICSVFGVLFVIISYHIYGSYFIAEPSPIIEVDTLEYLDILTKIHSAEPTIETIVRVALDATITLSKSISAGLLYKEKDNLHMYSLSTEDGTMNHLSGTNRVTKNKGLIGKVISKGRTISIKEGFQKDDNFSSLEQLFGMDYSAALCIPLMSGSKTLGVICCSSNKSFNSSIIMLLERVAANVTLAMLRYEQHKLNQRQRVIADVFLSVAESRSTDDTFQSMLQQIVNSVYRLVDAEYVSIFVVDQHRRELTLVASKDGFHGFTIDFDQGVSGYVASTALPVRIDDCYGDPRFDKKMDQFAQHTTKSMLCVPVLGFGTTANKSVAVIQAMNKESATSFTADDEAVLVSLAAEVSKTFKKRIVDVNSFAAAPTSDEYLEEGLYKEFGSTISKRFRIDSDMSVKSVPHTFSRSSSGRELNRQMLTPMTPSRSKSFIEDSFKVNTWNLDPFKETDESLLNMLMLMFYEFRVIEILGVDKNSLVTFIEAAKSRYRDNRFHNFRHAFAVTHISYLILKQGAAEYLTPLEQLAVLISAYCHDLDHPGNNNFFEINTKSKLAVLYSFDSVLERHHAHVAHTLLNSSDSNMTNNLRLGDLVEFRQLITHAILSTDMSKHQAEMDQLVKCAANNPHFDKECKVSRYHLISFVLHCADIGAQTQEQSIAVEWGERVIDEFTDQVQREIAADIPPTAFMMGMESELKRMQLQYGFTSGFVLPLWQGFAECLPQLQSAAEQCSANVIFYKSRVQVLQSASDESVSTSI